MNLDLYHNKIPRAARRHATRPAVGIGAAMCILMWWGGCSVEKNYELLSKFFDGVPDPNAPKLDRFAIAQSATYTEHKPYTDEACLECHTNPSDMVLAKDDSSMCTACHSDVTAQYAYMHGAVTGNACLMCHNPHLSALPNLLRDDGPGMCNQCHELDPDTLIPSHSTNNLNCIDCHSGHGGDTPYFIVQNALNTLNTQQSPQSPIPQIQEGNDGS